MNNSAEPTSGVEARSPLMKWVDEMQDVIKVITNLVEEGDRHRAVAESAQREYAELREEAGRLRVEVEEHRGLAEAAQRERDELREEVAALRGENDRLRAEQAEAGETAAKLLGEMKELVNQVAHKFQGPPRTSPFARDSRSPHA